MKDRNIKQASRSKHIASKLRRPSTTASSSPFATLERMLAHANKQLQVHDTTIDNTNTNFSPYLNARLKIYQRFLKIEEHRLRLKHLAIGKSRFPGSGYELCRLKAELIDILMRHIYSDCVRIHWPVYSAQNPPPIAMIATGGYGRGELNPYSDVDILFLHEMRENAFHPHADALIKQILYFMWDLGFKVGHATRSIREAVDHANADHMSKTAMLETHLLAGPLSLYQKFGQRFESDCIQGHEHEYLKSRIDDQEQRHQKFGNSVFIQEPNIKLAVGGLRDYHNLKWAVRVCQKQLGPEYKILGKIESRALENGYDFLLRVRTDLNYLNGHPGDILTLFQQGQIAERFHYPQPTILRKSEAFMKDYYHHARNIHLITASAFERLNQEVTCVLPSTQQPLSKTRALIQFFTGPKPPANLPKIDKTLNGFVFRGNQIYPTDNEIFYEDPYRLLRVFQFLQEDPKLRISPELAQLIRRRLHLVNRTFQYAKEGREIFLTILKKRGHVARVLHAMHEVDLLGRYLPEFGELTCLVQHEFNHRYTADEHTLVCIEKLDALAFPHSDTTQKLPKKFGGYQALFQELEDPSILYLGLLLHDTGKATGASQHAEASAFFAQKVGARLHLDPEQRRMLTLLIDHHLTLSFTAQTRNLEDAATISEFANIVKNRATLDQLMLLTLADGQGTSDKNWSDWKESLVWQLYRRTARYLEGGEALYRHNVKRLGEQRRALVQRLTEDYADEIDAHFQHMPNRYFEAFSTQAIQEHLLLFRQFYYHRLGGQSEPTIQGLEPVLACKDHAHQGYSEILIVTWDRSEMLRMIAGTFACAGLNIFSVDCFKREDQLALYVLRVGNPQRYRPVEHSKELIFVKNLLTRAALVEHYDFKNDLEKTGHLRKQSWLSKKRRLYHLSNALFPTRIVTREDPTRKYTLLEIQIPDRSGLLFDLLTILKTEGMQVALFRIATEKGAAIISFYLTDLQGAPIENPEVLRKLREELRTIG